MLVGIGTEFYLRAGLRRCRGDTTAIMNGGRSDGVSLPVLLLPAARAGRAPGAGRCRAQEYQIGFGASGVVVSRE